MVSSNLKNVIDSSEKTRTQRERAKRVRKLREARGWSQLTLGETAGCSQQTIQQIEDENTSYKATGYLVYIAKALGTTAEHLEFGGEAQRSQTSPINIELMAKYIALVDELLSSAKGRLTPAKRAELVALCYQLETEGKALNETEIRGLIKLAG